MLQHHIQMVWPITRLRWHRSHLAPRHPIILPQAEVVAIVTAIQVKFVTPKRNAAPVDASHAVANAPVPDRAAVPALQVLTRCYSKPQRRTTTQIVAMEKMLRWSGLLLCFRILDRVLHRVLYSRWLLGHLMAIHLGAIALRPLNETTSTRCSTHRAPHDPVVCPLSH